MSGVMPSAALCVQQPHVHQPPPRAPRLPFAAAQSVSLNAPPPRAPRLPPPGERLQPLPGRPASPSVH